MKLDLTQKMKKLMSSLPEKDIPLGFKFLNERNFDSLSELTSSAIVKIKNGLVSPNQKLVSKYSCYVENNGEKFSQLEELDGEVTAYKERIDYDLNVMSAQDNNDEPSYDEN